MLVHQVHAQIMEFVSTYRKAMKGTRINVYVPMVKCQLNYFRLPCISSRYAFFMIIMYCGMLGQYFPIANFMYDV
jgi:hypothetical protein